MAGVRVEVMAAKTRKIIYILGLAHSGSTVLDMLLTTTGLAVGLGQVWNVLREDLSKTKQRLCSCGAGALDCELWAPIIDQLGSDDHLSQAERYQIVLNNVERLYGSAMAVVDSSKHAANLRTLTQVKGADVTVLHNIKDVRPFAISMIDNAARKGHRRELPEKIFYRWYKDNRASHATATQLLGQSPLRVTYESLCLATEVVAGRLAERLGNRYIDPLAEIDSGITHIISGNRLRLPGVGKTKRLSYDYRWLMRSEWLRPYFLMPMVRKYNEECLRELPSPRQAPTEI